MVKNVKIFYRISGSVYNHGRLQFSWGEGGERGKVGAGGVTRGWTVVGVNIYIPACKMQMLNISKECVRSIRHGFTNTGSTATINTSARDPTNITRAEMLLYRSAAKPIPSRTD